MELNEQKHPSYGMAQFSRVTGGSRTMFGSNLKHSNTIILRVSTGSVSRKLNQDWYLSDKRIVEVEFSQTQFAELLTSMNYGSGVPCTIRYNNGYIEEKPPARNPKTEYNNEFKQTLDKISKDMEESQMIVDRLLEQGSLKKTDRELLKCHILKLKQFFNSNSNFIYKQFAESVDNTISAGKAELDAFLTHGIQKLGLESLQKLNGDNGNLVEFET